MGFVGSVKSCFSKYATFSGRARRSEFWWFYLFTLIVGIVAYVIDRLVGWNVTTNDVIVNGETYTVASAYNPGWIQVVAGLAVLLPMIAVSVRRLHDRDASGWWWWLQLLNCLCGLGTLILVFAFYIQPGTAGANKYGPDPKSMAPTA
ncbi:MAG: hypothetical protein QG597_3569 [Actinomycetota bacterium]|nr:hypothetical protein [Actinomycetota bacterium]